MQTKKQSLTEAVTNTAVGFCISLLSIFLIFPIFGIESTPVKNLGITAYFTIISIARSYVLRRFFNKKRTQSKTAKTRNGKQQWVLNYSEKGEILR